MAWTYSALLQLWQCSQSGPTLVHTFEASAGAVLSLVVRNETVYAGCQDGHVKVFDLDMRTVVRTIIAQEVSALFARIRNMRCDLQ